jgi:hypothetical protein
VGSAEGTVEGMATGRFWKPGHGTVEYSGSKRYDLGDLPASSVAAKAASPERSPPEGSKLMNMRFMKEAALKSGPAKAEATPAPSGWKVSLRSSESAPKRRRVVCVVDDSAHGSSGVAGRASFHDFNPKLETYASERRDALTKAEGVASATKGSVSDAKMAAALGAHALRAPGLSKAKRRQMKQSIDTVSKRNPKRERS